MKKRRRGATNGASRAQAITATSAMPMLPVNQGVLAQHLFADQIPRAENERRHYGKYLDLQAIDWALRSATHGHMAAITFISREQLTYDGHLSAVLLKRINRVAALDYDVVASTGQDIDTKKAELYADFVRAQIDAVPRFRDTVIDLAWGVYDNRAASELDWCFRWQQWNLLGINWINPTRLSFGPHRDVRVVDTRMDVGGFREDQGYPIQQVPYKFCVYTPRLFNDYQEREGLAVRTLYWSYFARASVRERLTLQELFGRPWRVIKPIPGDLAASNVEARDKAFETVQRLGQHNTARLPPGYDLQIIQPFTGAGQIAGDIIDHASKIQSKLVLGSTGTTDAVSTGLGSSIGNAHLSEEDLIIWSDARRLGEAIEDQITDAIIAVNFGPLEVTHAPRFVFRTEAPVSREEEGNRIAKALDIGLRVSEEEAREKLGVQEIQPGMPYLVKVTTPTSFGQIPQPPAPALVYPIGKAPQPGEVAAEPAIAFNLLPGGGGQPPLATPPGGGLPPGAEPPALPAMAPAPTDLGPDDDEPDAVAVLCERMNELQIDRCEHGRVNLCAWCGIQRRREVELGPDGEAVWAIIWEPIKATAPLPTP